MFPVSVGIGVGIGAVATPPSVVATSAAAASLDRRFILVDQNPESIAVMRERFAKASVPVEFVTN